jgi:hypothetical protein
VFRDIDTLAPGAEFARVIQERIRDCDAVVVVIGRQWLALTDANGRRRLDDPQDLLAAEIAKALRQGKLVVPALLDAAPMPTKAELPPALAALAERNAIEISDKHFDYDVGQLIRALGGKHGKSSWWRALGDADIQHTLTFFGGAIAAVVAAGWALYVYLHPKPELHPTPQPQLTQQPAAPSLQSATQAPSVTVIQKDIQGRGNTAIGVEGATSNGALGPGAAVKVEQSGVTGESNVAVGVRTGTPSKNSTEQRAKENKK